MYESSETASPAGVQSHHKAAARSVAPASAPRNAGIDGPDDTETRDGPVALEVVGLVR